jgi:hypothetical protein
MSKVAEVYLEHENVRPHKPENTGSSQINRKAVLRHPPYSQDLAVTDLRLFGAHKYPCVGKVLGGMVR